MCAICLLEKRLNPNKHVTHMQGTAVCEEHVAAVGTADLLSFTYKIRNAAKARNSIKALEAP